MKTTCLKPKVAGFKFQPGQVDFSLLVRYGSSLGVAPHDYSPPEGSTPELVLFHVIFFLRLCLRAPSLNNAVYVISVSQALITTVRPKRRIGYVWFYRFFRVNVRLLLLRITQILNCLILLKLCQALLKKLLTLTRPRFHCVQVHYDLILLPFSGQHNMALEHAMHDPAQLLWNVHEVKIVMISYF